MKYYCNKCGHHFEGPLYVTQECPQCGSDDIDDEKFSFPKKWIYITLSMVATVVIIFLILKFLGGTSRVKCSMDVNADFVTIIVTSGKEFVPNKTYIVRVFDEEGSVVDSCYVSHGQAIFSKANMDKDGEIYKFEVFRIDNGDLNCKWNTDHIFVCEIEKAPCITVSDEDIVYDKKTRTFTITVHVTSGHSTQFWIYYYDLKTNDSTILCLPQQDSVFHNVRPGDYRIFIRAMGENNMISEPQDRMLEAPFDFSEEDINRILNYFNAGKEGYRSGDVCDSLFKCESSEKLIKNDRVQLEEDFMMCELMDQKCYYNSKSKKIQFK